MDSRLGGIVCRLIGAGSADHILRSEGMVVVETYAEMRTYIGYGGMVAMEMHSATCAA